MTYGQFEVLYNHAQKREGERLKFEAALHGVKLEDNQVFESEEKVKDIRSKSLFVFRDPKEYEEMSVEERKELTQKMMGLHKQWNESKPLGGKTPIIYDR